MSSVLMESPPPRIAPATPPPDLALPTGRRRRDPPWLFPLAIVVSVLLHMAVFHLFRFATPVPRGPIVGPIPANARALEGMHAYNITTSPEAPPIPQTERTLPAQPRPAPRQPSRVAPPPVNEVAPATPTNPATPEKTTPVPSVSERLRPHAGDGRLWATPPDLLLPPERTPAEMAREQLYGDITEYNDSLAADAEAARRATDWTIRDKNGGRWGVSPGQIHLGSLTIPLPFSFAPPPGRRDEINMRVRDWAATQEQARREGTRESFDDRVRAIRDRKDAERKADKKSDKKSGDKKSGSI